MSRRNVKELIREDVMQGAVFIVATIGFFIAAIGYVIFCERVQ
ncbi:MAG TPA: hypothetical protein VKB60_09395 [Terriglobales bacterium]|nr:hypothetical protein [Terriglobales bacterium]